MTQTSRSNALGLAAKNTPMLTEETERALFEAYRNKRDHRARNKIALAHLRLVSGEAARFARYRMPTEDLITEGNIAIMQAIDGFDPARGVRFCAYARHWVRSAMIAHVIRSRSLVTISGTKANKRLFFQLDRTRASIAAAHGGKLPANANDLIAQSLGVTKASVEAMSARLAGDQSCDAPAGPETETTLIETLASDDESADTILIRSETIQIALEALQKLSDQERHIITARIFTDAETVPELAHIAANYGVTPQRVHQIQKSALAKIRVAILSATS